MARKTQTHSDLRSGPRARRSPRVLASKPADTEPHAAGDAPPAADGSSLLIVGTTAREARRLGEMLGRAGTAFTIAHARSLEDCARALEASTYWLILLELRAPRRDALATLVRVRHLAPGIPIVVLVNGRQEGVARTALEMGADDYLVKEHLTPELLEHSVRHAIRLGPTARLAREGEEHYRLLYVDGPFMFFTLARDATILSASRYGAEQLGRAAEDLVGTSFLALVLGGYKRSALVHLKRALSQPQRPHRWETCLRRKDGELLWTRLSARAGAGHDGMLKLACVCEDITEARNLSEQLSYQASHDALTGLVNRREFENRLRRVLALARRDHTEHAFCYLDLDRFKIINDTCGHVAGDELLRQLGRLLQRVVRKRDTLARLGGDEFGVLMECCTLDQAQRVANALRRAVADFRFAWENRSLHIGVSIGMVPVTAATGSISSVLSAADAACYTAKEQGRSRIHVYHEDDIELARRYGEMQWVARIERALEDDRFELSVQPIAPVEAPAGPEAEALHYELLLRMRDEHGRLVLPGAFLPAAERYDLAGHLDRWVIDTAFSWLSVHPEHLAQLWLCCINLSARSLANEEFLSYVIGRFDDTGIAPEKICFEVTETAAIANLSSATRFVRALQEWGCRFALDDFGSGLSSFAYLKNLPVDFLKIDGVFVRGILDDPVDLAMVKSINEIGQAFGKKTIAEFVESKAILDKLRLRYIGVDYAQGYAVGRPQPLEHMLPDRGPTRGGGKPAQARRP
jgi:diguanylate cyclase (GGDEF)-like protein/PAS domain S-box-containing protein